MPPVVGQKDTSMSMIDKRENSEIHTPKVIIPTIETASLVINEITIPKESSLETFAKHINNLDRLRSNLFLFAENKYGFHQLKEELHKIRNK